MKREGAVSGDLAGHSTHVDERQAHRVSTMSEPTPHSAPALDVSTRLAFDRTRAAYERTMMAWIRTSTSLITFGFSIYKFFQIEAPPGRPNRVIGPHGFSLILVSIGLFSLILATLEYRQNIRELGTEFAGKLRSLAVLVAGLISILGVLALVAIIFRQ
jgi:putative membrane protein